ncbi:MAG: hypothetical protein FJ096_10705 [Deltaproteobacteria bacterium]|nr:hypothetical protein [Deltaproteobacteria bacterium]
MLRGWMVAGVMASVMVLGAGCGSSADDTSDTGGATSTGTGGGSCPTQAQGNVANKITLRVSWGETIGLEAGEADVIIWTRASLDFDGNEVTGEVQPCGSVVPPLQTKQIVGGNKVQPIIPDAVWDAMGIPKTAVFGSISGFQPGATITMQPVGTGVGADLADPVNDAWPASWADVKTTDPDGDGNPGMTATPNTSAGFAAPPLGLDPMGPRAEKLFLSTRTVVQLEGKRDTCTSAKGTAQVTKFDNHVVGCIATGGTPCTPDQADFVDGNRVIYTLEGATYEMKQVPAGATCADVRAALP